MQTQEAEKPAVVRIENKMLHALDVPIPGPGKSVLRTVRIPKASAKGEPGVYEGTDFDALTLNRLRYHYDWRPNDPKLYGTERKLLAPSQVSEIGLLRITVMKPGEARPEGRQAKAS
jgi:hypothetical protein